MSNPVSDMFSQLRELVRGSEITIMLSIAVGMVVWRMMGSEKKEDKTKAKKKVEDRPNEVLTFREYTRALLGEYNGTVMGKPLLVGIRGSVYDVTASAAHYGPGGGYGAFSGRDASRMLAKMQTSPDEQDPSIDDLLPAEKETLDGWESFFAGKYKKVGTLVDKQPVVQHVSQVLNHVPSNQFWQKPQRGFPLSAALGRGWRLVLLRALSRSSCPVKEPRIVGLGLLVDMTIPKRSAHVAQALHCRNSPSLVEHCGGVL
eukprot:CAMPEP_0181290328 /NCGR_PEP_ID=MMETSP1101-20121128/1356_1 /TAXON_ID=46948 /ORGANISM="Rhodomonas abbreviata, Strain Caron Lab Isolate" /LENGTH=258 /DNA_ID=CAMNT_0023394607 /DNA_START=20 /DNA_END=797 /DNA_ORIENTATION=+